jgi:hypothetical protein
MIMVNGSLMNAATRPAREMFRVGFGQLTFYRDWL